MFSSAETQPSRQLGLQHTLLNASKSAGYLLPMWAELQAIYRYTADLGSPTSDAMPLIRGRRKLFHFPNQQVWQTHSLTTGQSLATTEQMTPWSVTYLGKPPGAYDRSPPEKARATQPDCGRLWPTGLAPHQNCLVPFQRSSLTHDLAHLQLPLISRSRGCAPFELATCLCPQSQTYELCFFLSLKWYKVKSGFSISTKSDPA